MPMASSEPGLALLNVPEGHSASALVFSTLTQTLRSCFNITCRQVSVPVFDDSMIWLQEVEQIRKDFDSIALKHEEASDIANKHTDLPVYAQLIFLQCKQCALLMMACPIPGY